MGRGRRSPSRRGHRRVQRQRIRRADGDDPPDRVRGDCAGTRCARGEMGVRQVPLRLRVRAASRSTRTWLRSQGERPACEVERSGPLCGRSDGALRSPDLRQARPALLPRRWTHALHVVGARPVRAVRRSMPSSASPAPTPHRHHDSPRPQLMPSPFPPPERANGLDGEGGNALESFVFALVYLFIEKWGS